MIKWITVLWVPMLSFVGLGIMGIILMWLLDRRYLNDFTVKKSNPHPINP